MNNVKVIGFMLLSAACLAAIIFGNLSTMGCLFLGVMALGFGAFAAES